jgi:hypothetical protein
MKKYFYNIASVLILGTALTACSDEDIASNGMSMEEALAPSEYTITLGATTDAIESKAAITSNQGAFSTDQLGVFMLAMNVINTPLTPYWGREYGDDCSWYRSEKDTHDSAIDGYAYGFAAYLDNMPATAHPKSTTKPSLGSELELKNGAVERYPVGSFHRYNFYAYTPRVATIEYKKDSVLAVMTELDGTQDVIYSAAIPGDKYNTINSSYKDYAWSANYFRLSQNRTSDGTDEPLESLTPKFHFTHKMAQLMFSVQPGGIDKNGNPVDESSKTTELNYDEALETEVVGISICNVPDSVVLLVAERSGLHNGDIKYSAKNRHAEYFLKSYVTKTSGSRTLYYADAVMPVQTLSTKKTTTRDDDGKRVTTETPVVTKLGGPDDTHRQGIILPALTNEDRKSIDGSYVAKLVVRYPRSSTKAKYYTIDIPLYSDPENPNMQFQAGCSYEVMFRIYGPNTVKSSSQEREWVEVDEEDLKESGNYDLP